MTENYSKSEKKRQAAALQSLGVTLITLSAEKLKTLPLSEALYQALIEAKSIKSHGAQRRQAQLIGKLIRSCDHEAISLAYKALLETDNLNTAHFHEAERWRAALIEGHPETLTEFIKTYQPNDLQHFRHLIKKAQAQVQAPEQNQGAAKALFRYLRSFIK